MGRSVRRLRRRCLHRGRFAQGLGYTDRGFCSKRHRVGPTIPGHAGEEAWRVKGNEVPQLVLHRAAAPVQETL
jgi:hypothetical protein